MKNTLDIVCDKIFFWIFRDCGDPNSLVGAKLFHKILGAANIESVSGELASAEMHVSFKSGETPA